MDASPSPHLRWIPTAAVLGLAAWLLVWTFQKEPGSEVKPHAAMTSMRTRPTAPLQKPAAAEEVARRQLEDAPPVDLDFHDAPLPAILDELVRQSGIQVVADLGPEQDAKRVTLQMNAPPFRVLQTITADHGMELLHTPSGWWLRPLDALQSVCYQIHGEGLEPGTLRVENLTAALRKLTGDQNEVRVSADADGIHIKAPREIQTLAAQFLESAFSHPVPSVREDLPSVP